MRKGNDIENKEIEDSIDFIDYNLSIFETIAESVVVDKRLPKSLANLRKLIFDYIDNNNHIDIGEDIILIDKIISDTYASFSNDILASSTYDNNESGMDKLDNKCLVDLIDNAYIKINSIINKTDIEIKNTSLEDARIIHLREELNNIVMKQKMMGVISYNISFDKINEIIEYVSTNYYLLHLSIIEPLFIESIKNINNVSYDKYELEMEKMYLYSSVNNIENNMYAYLDEDGKDKLQEIKDIIKNVSNFNNIDDIGIIIEYLENIQFIRYEYPSVDIWKRMILELLSMIMDLMNRIIKDNNKEELLRLKELYFNLRKKYYQMIFIGTSRDIIDVDLTERENLVLVRK